METHAEAAPGPAARPAASPTWVIGAGPDCDLVIDRPTVSGHHCRLTQDGETFLLEDLQSRNGTFVNGQRIAAPTIVSRKDTITLGRDVPLPWPEPAPAVPSRTIRIGRVADNDVVLDYPTVSAHHAQIVITGEQVRIEDLQSTNGTAIGAPDRRIQRADLTGTEVVYFGSLRVPAARLLSGKLAMGGQPHTEMAVRQEATIFGRDPRCDHVLDDPLVSRRHARLTRADTGLSLEDLRSANGTFVNGQRLNAKAAIQPGDLIGIGRFTFKVTPEGQLEQRDYRGNVSIEAQGVTVDVRDRRLLNDISLTVYPSEFVALMGPSGAGKTTLMNALNGYTPPTSGSVRFSGRDLYANFGQFQGVIGYVPQDDIMHGELTVGQALYYTARLRLPPDSSDAEIASRVQKVVAQLGLDGTENVLIGSPQKKGISGGQRKRVNLAMELLTDPAVLFLDEPTSGLSSEDALNVMRLLRRLADEGKTILLTIHQPSLEAYRLLDNLILVAKDQGTKDPGSLVYYGPAYPQAVEFFNPQLATEPKTSPRSPDDVLRGLAKEKSAHWGQRYQASLWKRQYVDDRAGKQPKSAGKETAAQKRHPAMELFQWWTLVRRALAIKGRDRMNTAILMAQAPIIAILIALVFGSEASKDGTAENWAAVASAVSTTVFLMALAALWFGCSNSAREIVGEWAIYHRERMVNLKIPSYVGSKVAVLGGLCLVQCAVLLGIVHWGAGLQGPWLGTFLVLLLTSWVGLAIGLTVSAVAKTSEVAIALLPLILLPMVILAGVLQPLHKMNAMGATLAQMLPSRWAFESLLLLETDQRPTWTRPAMPVPPPAATGKKAEAEPLGGVKSEGVKPEAAKRENVEPADKRPEAKPENKQPQEDGETNPPQAEDMAERFFPQDTERMGTRAGVIALGAMLVLLVAAIHGILRVRDVH